jgi:hypothetical protein
VTGNGRPHRPLVVIPEQRRALEIGEQERHRPARRLVHGQPAGSQNSSWMLSGSRKTITVPIAVSVTGV